MSFVQPEEAEPTTENYFLIRSVDGYWMELDHVVGGSVCVALSTALDHPFWQERYDDAVAMLRSFADGIAGFQVPWIAGRDDVIAISEVYQT